MILMCVCILVRRTIGKPEELEQLANFNRAWNEEQQQQLVSDTAVDQ